MPSLMLASFHFPLCAKLMAISQKNVLIPFTPCNSHKGANGSSCRFEKSFSKQMTSRTNDVFKPIQIFKRRVVTWLFLKILLIDSLKNNDKKCS